MQAIGKIGDRYLELKENSLVRYVFLRLLRREFDICIRQEDLERAELAKLCIVVYDSPEEFYESTGWARDNPDSCDFSYLLENRICRIIDGKVWYFSRLRYEEGVKRLQSN